jgi:thiol-disulfide isomerase/thioredoxin
MFPIFVLAAALVQSPADAEAMSWQARAALAQHDFAHANQFADEAYQYAQKLDISKDPHLQTALGAAIEVHALALAMQGQRADAVTYLREQAKIYSKTAIASRIQKNLNLLSLEGKPAPPLDTAHWLGSRPPLTKGKPVLLFFWAHWCSDCKAEAPLLSQLPKDLVVIAPTQHYGYIGAIENVPPADETKYIDAVRQRFYPNLPVPLSEENFKTYGASTTPTLVFIDRRGIVRVYHPGAMTQQELLAAAAKL